MPAYQDIEVYYVILLQRWEWEKLAWYQIMFERAGVLT